LGWGLGHYPVSPSLPIRSVPPQPNGHHTFLLLSKCASLRFYINANSYISHGNLHGGMAVPDPASTFFVAMHDNATSLSRSYLASPPLDDKDQELKLANLKKVKWARFDYITEWQQCARWMVTRPPWLLFVSDHGKEVRFLGTRSISAEGKKLFSFMAYRSWETLTTWKPIPL
jgi:hypothetical protein